MSFFEIIASRDNILKIRNMKTNEIINIECDIKHEIGDVIILEMDGE